MNRTHHREGVNGPRMPFGKHRGEPLSAIPHRYLFWVLDNCENLSPTLRQQIELTLGIEEPTPGVISTSVVNQWCRECANIFHPDKGGSHEAMKAINLGRELLLQRIEESR